MSVSPVCRTCLVVISGDKTGHNIDYEKATQSARAMISFCLPEMDTYVSMSPSICDKCFDVLINFYNFKVRCLQVENAIHSYIAANDVVESSSVDLRTVARLQALEAMKQMRWSYSTGWKSIATVEKCLVPNKTTQQQAVLTKCTAAASTALPAAKATARQTLIEDSSKKDGSYIKVRKDLMPGKQKANSALTVNPVNFFASKEVNKHKTGQRGISQKPYDALQLCPATGVFKKYPGKEPKRVSKCDDGIIEDSHQSDDDEVILINDNEQDSAPAKSPEKAPTVKTYSAKRKLQRPVAVDETEAKRPKVQTSPDPSSPISPKKNEKELVVRLRKERMLKCAFCTYVTLKINTLMGHYYRCHKVCKLCNFRCVRTFALNKHISQKHLAQLRDVSEFYEKVTPVTDFICGLCKFSSNVALDLVEHRLEKHIQKDQHELHSCPFLYCEFRHAIAMNVAEHIERTHDRPDRKECLVCNFVASSPVKLRRHAEFHDQTLSTCTVCGYRCKTSLKKHMEKNHQIADWVQDDTVVGMVADDVLMYYDKLTSSDDFKITLASSQPAEYTVPSVSTAATGNDDDTYSWDQPSLSEMLSGHVLAQVPQQQEAAESVDDKVLKIAKSSKEKGKRPRKTKVLNDSDDCVLVGDVGRAVVTIDLSDESEMHLSDAQTTCSEKSNISSEELIAENNLSGLALSRGSNEAEAVAGSGNVDYAPPSATSSEETPGQDVDKDNEVSESVVSGDTRFNLPVRNEDKEDAANCHQVSLDVVKEVADLPAEEPSSLSNNESMEIKGRSKNAPLEDVSESVDNDTGLASPVRNEDKELEANCNQDSLEAVEKVDGLSAEPSFSSKTESMEVKNKSKNLCVEGEAPKSVVENCSETQNSIELVQGKCDE